MIVIREILKTVDFIDILKIDTEGTELRTIEALDPELARRIKRIYLEADPHRALHPDIFWQRQYGGMCQLMNKYV